MHHDPPNLRRFHAKLGITVADVCPSAITAKTAGVADPKEVLL
ncbi:MAG: hypothetical protein ACEQSB_01440 [Undibacterium sp.]